VVSYRYDTLKNIKKLPGKIFWYICLLWYCQRESRCRCAAYLIVTCYYYFYWILYAKTVAAEFVKIVKVVCILCVWTLWWYWSVVFVWWVLVLRRLLLLGGEFLFLFYFAVMLCRRCWLFSSFFLSFWQFVIPFPSCVWFCFNWPLLLFWFWTLFTCGEW